MLPSRQGEGTLCSDPERSELLLVYAHTNLAHQPSPRRKPLDCQACLSLHGHTPPGDGPTRVKATAHHSPPLPRAPRAPKGRPEPWRHAQGLAAVATADRPEEVGRRRGRRGGQDGTTIAARRM